MPLRWPLLPVAAQLQLATEPLLMSMMEQGRADLAVGVGLLTECNAGFAESDAAAACPRLKRRKGSVRLLAFTVFGQYCYVISEDGALLMGASDDGCASGAVR